MIKQGFSLSGVSFIMKMPYDGDRFTIFVISFYGFPMVDKTTDGSYEGT